MPDMWLSALAETSALVKVLRVYLETNVLLAVAALLCWSVWAWEVRARDGRSARAYLRLTRGVLVGALLLPSLVALLLTRVPQAPLPLPPIQVWSGEGAASTQRTGMLLKHEGTSTLPAFELSLSRQQVELPVLLLLCGILGFSLHLRSTQRKLAQQLHQHFLIHQRGRIRVVLSAHDTLPYATWTGGLLRPGIAWMVLPQRLLLLPETLRLSRLHEAQHLRQRDPQWLQLELWLRVVCFWNPAVWVFRRLFIQLQELACDAALVGQPGVSSRAYGRCLLEMAHDADLSAPLPAGTTGMGLWKSSPLLSRRIEMILQQPQSIRRSYVPLLTVLSLLLLLSTTVVSRAAVQSQTLTLTQAQALFTPALQKKAAEEQLGLKLTPAVLEKLNRFLGTPEGRSFLKQGLVQMQTHQALVSRALQDAKLPSALLAVPLLESGYKNLPSSSREPSAAAGPRGAGIWMFIVPTAQKYGLKVEGTLDERLDVQKETTAAIKLLTDLYTHFQDWPLALAGYNQGERWVENAIQTGGTRDAWQLVEKGLLNDYLPTFMTSWLVLQQPQLVE